MDDDAEGNQTLPYTMEFLPSLPVKLEVTLNELEKILRDSDHRGKDEYKALINRIGGKNVGDHLRSVLAKVIDDKLLEELFTWMGNTRESTKGASHGAQKVKKRSFKETEISKILCDTLAKTYKIKISEVEPYAKVWVQHVKERTKKAAEIIQ